MIEDDWIEADKIAGEKILVLLVEEIENVNVAFATLMDLVIYICYEHEVTIADFNNAMNLAKAKYEMAHEGDNPC